MRGHVRGRVGGQSERPCERLCERPCKAMGGPRWEAMRGQGGRPCEAKVGGCARPKWEGEAEVGGLRGRSGRLCERLKWEARFGRPCEAEVGGRSGRPKWEAVGGRSGRPCEAEVGGPSVRPKWEAV